MSKETYSDLLTEREVAMAFNMRLKSAIYILESAEDSSPEGRKYLIDELKRQIAGSEVDCTLKLIESISKEKQFHSSVNLPKSILALDHNK